MGLKICSREGEVFLLEVICCCCKEIPKVEHLTEKRASCLTVSGTECPKPVSTINLVFGFREGLLAAEIRMGGHMWKSIL